MFNGDSIFWVEVDKIKPNPYQPRRVFDEDRLRDLADSIRQYGVLQPLVVTRKEVERPEGGLAVLYELIAGERRLRASKIAGVFQVPVVIRKEDGEESGRLKLELAIIENIQREDLNPVERARAFRQLVDEFRFKHIEIAQKVGKSREYVTNSLRLLLLPEEMVEALSLGRMSEGHTRPLLMLTDRPEDQKTLFKDIIERKMNVRQAEIIARHTAQERARKRDGDMDPKILELEEKFKTHLGTKVSIEMKNAGGRIMIDFYSPEDLDNLLKHFEKKETIVDAVAELTDAGMTKPQTDDDLYSVKNFTV